MIGMTTAVMCMAAIDDIPHDPPPLEPHLDEGRSISAQKDEIPNGLKEPGWRMLRGIAVDVVMRGVDGVRGELTRTSGN